MFEMFTDVALRKGNAVATCFIRTPSTFIGYKVFEYNRVGTTLHGELLAIHDGLEYLLSLNIDTSQPIKVYCDSRDALNQIQGNTSEIKFKTIIQNIKDITSDVDVKYLFIKGHQTHCNPNKVVDKISNTVLRYKHPMKR